MPEFSQPDIWFLSLKRAR